MVNICQLFTRIMPNKWSLFDQQCVLCCGLSANSAICQPCMAELPRPLHPCNICGIEISDPHSIHCSQCQPGISIINRCYTGLTYQSPVDFLVQRLKFHADFTVSNSLGAWFANELSNRIETTPELVIPIPLHPGRHFQRGFNQAVELARPIAKKLGAELSTNAVHRIRPTASQSGLNAQSRAANLQTAFAAKPDRIKNRHVAIVDDVMTTGATTQSLANTLIEAGAAQIDLYILARTPRKN